MLLRSRNAISPCLRQTSAVDTPRSCSATIAMICSSVNLLFRMSVFR